MLADGRGGLAKDPVQAYVWLNLAVENGSTPAARDFVAKALTPDQLAAATRLLAERRSGKAPPAAPAGAPDPAAPPPKKAGQDTHETPSPDTITLHPLPLKKKNHNAV